MKYKVEMEIEVEVDDAFKGDIASVLENEILITSPSCLCDEEGDMIAEVLSTEIKTLEVQYEPENMEEKRKI